jgi:hypothetical protein
MNNQRQEAYINLIFAILNCPNNDEILALLKANQELIDSDFLQTIQAIAGMMQERGDNETSKYLQNLAAYITSFFREVTAQDYLSFLMEVLQATADSNANPQVVYPLLQANLDKLDDNFIQIFHTWATETLVNIEPEKSQYIAKDICLFSYFIQQYNLGRRETNLDKLQLFLVSILLIMTPIFLFFAKIKTLNYILVLERILITFVIGFFRIGYCLI